MMKEEYDLSKMQRRKNPFAAKLKKPVTIRLGEDVVDYLSHFLKKWAFPTSH